MDWFWKDSKAKSTAEKTNPIEPNNYTSSAPAEASYPPSTQSPESSTQASQPSSEFEHILKEFQTPSPRVASAEDGTFNSSTSYADSFDRKDWRPSILYPSTMSCTSAFDQAMFCQILGGQFKNYYRFGTMRNCGELWSNFWFCMRTNRGFMSDEEREKRIQAFYMTREAKLKKGGSSEDVWEAREEQDMRPWAREQFIWDLIRFEKGEAVLREDSVRNSR